MSNAIPLISGQINDIPEIIMAKFLIIIGAGVVFSFAVVALGRAVL